MPEATLRAFADHGDATRGFGDEHRRRDAPPRRRTRASTSPPSPRTSSAKACASFCDSYHELLDCIETKLERAEPAGSPRS